MNKKNRWFVKAMNLKRFILPFVPPFYSWKEGKACSNFWEFWVRSRWHNSRMQAPTFKTVVAFVFLLTLFKLPDPGANIYVQSLLKFPTWGAHERSKSPPHPVVPPLGHNIDSCINRPTPLSPFYLSLILKIDI